MSLYRSDTELFAAFHRGEKAAVQELYNRHYKPLCFFAKKFTGSTGDAEDLATESFLKLLDKKTEFQNLSNIKSFLYLVTRNAGLNFIKANAVHQTAHEQIRFLTPVSNDQNDPANEELLRITVLQQIREEIENLPDRTREIFKLLFYEELTTEQIGQRLSITAQSVRTSKARALEMIRTSLLKKNLLPALLYLSLTFPSGHFSAN